MKNNTEHQRYDVTEWREDMEKSWWASVYIAGDLDIAEKVCRKICFPKGLCVTVERVTYIFGGGTESGVRVGLIQYPPFPEDEATLLSKAVNIGQKVAEANYQWSFSIVRRMKIISIHDAGNSNVKLALSKPIQITPKE